MKYSISKQRRSQAWWFQHYSVISLQHLNNDFHDNQTMSKPEIMQRKPKSAMCQFFPSIYKPQNLGDSEEFLQRAPCTTQLILTSLLRAQHSSSWFNLWMSLFRVKTCLHGLHRFTSRCPPMSMQYLLVLPCPLYYLGLRCLNMFVEHITVDKFKKKPEDICWTT